MKKIKYLLLLIAAVSLILQAYCSSKETLRKAGESTYILKVCNRKKEEIKMANKIKAIAVYRPRIKLGRTVKQDELVSYMVGRTGLGDGEISLVLKELRDAVAYFNLSGRGVKLEGLGTYTPGVKLNGRMSVGHRTDQEIKNRINTPNRFRGQIINRDMIGSTLQDLIDRWNKEHPDDPISQ